jgi:D-aspartate ligase
LPVIGQPSGIDPALAGIDAAAPIFVLRRSFATLQHAVLNVARSAGRLGIPVYAVQMGPGEPTMRSRYIGEGLRVPADATDEQLLEALLRFAQNRPPPMLLPIDDPSAIFASDHQARLAEHFLMPPSPAGVHRQLASKRQLCGLCERLGIPAPASEFPSSEAQAAASGETFGYPVVLKRSDAWLPPNDPSAPSVQIVGSESELIDFYRRMESPVAPQVIVQEYIPGGSDSIWMFNGYFTHESTCLCAFTGQKLRQRGPHTGSTTLGVCVWNESVAGAAQLLVREVGYQGIVDMGFRYDARDGKYKLLDVNPRMGSTFRLFSGPNGLDVVRAAYLDLTGQPVPDARALDGRKWVVEPYDVLAGGQIRRQDGLALADWLRSLRGVQEGAWWARDDPLPFLAMVASLGPLALRYWLRHRRKRVVRQARSPVAEPGRAGSTR